MRTSGTWRIVWLAVAMTTGFIPVVTAEAKPLKVYILAGQSNMQGKGPIEGEGGNSLRSLVKNDTKKQYQFLVDETGAWVERKDVWYYEKDGDRVCNLKANLGAAARRFGPKIGPELAFGHVMGDHFDEQVLLPLDVGVQRRAEHAELPAQVTHRGAVISARGEEPSRRSNHVFTAVAGHTS